MSRRKFLENMRLDTRNSDVDSRRESLIASPLTTEKKPPSHAIEAHPHGEAEVAADVSDRALFTSTTESHSPASDPDEPTRGASTESADADVPSPPCAAAAEEELPHLFKARTRSNTIPFNYRAPPASPDGSAEDASGIAAAAQPNTPPKPTSAVESIVNGCGAVSPPSPPGPPVVTHSLLTESPHSSPRTARPGGSRVPIGPVPIPRLEGDDAVSPHDHTTSVHQSPRDVDGDGLSSAKDTPRAGSAEGAYGHYMRRRSAEATSPDGVVRQSSPPAVSPAAATTMAGATAPATSSSPSSPHALLPSGLGAGALEYRARSGSITRVENTLVAVQIELAREKKHNIDAEQRLQALTREVEALRAENTRLSAALGSAARRGSDSVERSEKPVAASGYTEELEKSVQHLSKTLVAKDAALAACEERIRLLEHRLADQVLAGGSAGELAPPPHTYSPGSTTPQTHVMRSSSPATSLPHVHEVRAEALRPYDSRADAPPTVHTVSSTRVDHTGASREVSLALARRVTDTRLLHGSQGQQAGEVNPSDSPAPDNISPRRRANSAVRPVRRSTAAATDSRDRVANGQDAPRRGSVVRRKGSTASALDRCPSASQTDRTTPAAVASARPPRKGSVSSAVNSSVNESGASIASSTAVKRRVSVSGPRASPLRRDSAARRQPSVSSRPGADGAADGAISGASERCGSARRRASISSVNATSAPRRASGAHPVQLQRTPNVALQDGSAPPRKSMMASHVTPYRGNTSPTRSVAPSMRSTTSTRSRPQISFNAKDDVTTMKGTTTTVVFRSRSPATMDFTPSRSPYNSALTPERDAQPFVSEHFSETTYHPNRLVRTPQEAPLGDTALGRTTTAPDAEAIAHGHATTEPHKFHM